MHPFLMKIQMEKEDNTHVIVIFLQDGEAHFRKRFKKASIHK